MCLFSLLGFPPDLAPQDCEALLGLSLGSLEPLLESFVLGLDLCQNCAADLLSTLFSLQSASQYYKGETRAEIVPEGARPCKFCSLSGVTTCGLLLGFLQMQILSGSYSHDPAREGTEL